MQEYGYRADYIHEGKLMLKLSRDNKLVSEHLDTHAIRMLCTNAIPHMLEIEVSMIDEEAHFHYTISSKRQLLPLLMVEACTEHQYYEWLLQLVRLLDNCRNYLLQPNHVLLNEQVLFIEGGIQGGKLFVPYIPTVDPLHPRAAIDSLQKIAMRLSSEVKEWKEDGLQRLIQLLYRDNLSFSELRKFIQSNLYPQSDTEDKLQDKSYREHKDRDPQLFNLNRETSSAMQMASIPERTYPFKHSEITLQRSILTSAERGLSAIHGAGDDSEQNDVSSRRVESAECSEEQLDPRQAQQSQRVEHNQQGQSRSWMIAIVITTAITALGWKFGYMRSSSTLGLILSCFVTCLGIVVGYTYRKGLLSAVVQGKSAQTKGLNDESFMKIQSKQSSSNDSMKIKLQHGANVVGDSDMHSKGQDVELSSWKVDREDVHDMSKSAEQIRSSRELAIELEEKPFTDYTTVLKANDRLGLEDVSTQQSELMKPVLERLAANQVVECNELDQWPFVIGRAEQGVHLTIRESGISKLHCEIRQEEGSYWVQDYGSKNGTELNGQLLIPYKKMELTAGDELKLAQISFRFRLLSVA